MVRADNSLFSRKSHLSTSATEICTEIHTYSLTRAFLETGAAAPAVPGACNLRYLRAVILSDSFQQIAGAHTCAAAATVTSVLINSDAHNVLPLPPGVW